MTPTESMFCFDGDRIQIRYRSAIEEEYSTERSGYIDNRTIDETEPFVVALCSRQIDSGLGGASPARVVEVVYPIGGAYTFHSIEGEPEKSLSFIFREKIKKASGSTVATNISAQSIQLIEYCNRI